MATGEFLKQHLPKFQFIAVAITVILGAHTIYDRFFKETEPVLIWDPEGFHIAPTSNYSSWQVSASRKKFRNDCPLRSFDASIVFPSAGLFILVHLLPQKIVCLYQGIQSLVVHLCTHKPRCL